MIFFQEKVWSVNLGDSRAIVSESNCETVKDLTVDHKPERNDERLRIEAAGGRIQQATLPGISIGAQLNIKIPYRLYPGGLSVSRSFGDASAKLKEFQGNARVLISEPEISVY